MLRIKDAQFALHKFGDEYTEFLISNMDISGTAQYFGYIAHAGYWTIMKWDTTTNIFTYASGQAIATYTPNWNGSGAYIGALTFQRADLVF